MIAEEAPEVAASRRTAMAVRPVRRGGPPSSRSRSRGGSAPAPDWREPVMDRLRALVVRADPESIEQVKWRKPSNPAGVPVWSDDGMICFGNLLKDAVRLTFPSGADLEDPEGLFNARLESRTARAIDVRAGDSIRADALVHLVRRAVARNRSARTPKE